MFNLQTTLIAAAIALSIGLISGGYTAWKYQGARYEKQLSEVKEKAAATLADATKRVLDTERKNIEITASLEKQAQAHNKRVAELYAANNLLRNERGGLLVRAASCEDSRRASVSTPTDASAGTSQAGAICELSRGFTEFLTLATRDADEMRERLQVCKQYAEEIIKQRERMSDEK